MKKRLIGVLTAFSMLALPINSTCSAEEETSSLKELAKQLGWETDYFTFVNYSNLVSNSRTDEKYIKFLNSCSNAEIAADPFSDYYNGLGTGRCLAISSLEILSHNGIIKPSDIKAGSNYLTDITLDEEVKPLMDSYQLLQLHSEFDLYMKWYLTHYSSEEKVKLLVDTAERCMKEGKYFLMAYDVSNVSITASGGYSHAIAGIGISDGNWTFNNEQYDKCILTYDSNAVRAEFLPEKMVAWGFNENLCIYVNTKNNKLYCPALEIGTDDGLTFFCTDDETLINYKGAINPSETINTDLSLLTKVKIDSDGEYSITAQRPDRTVYDVIKSSYESNITKNSKSYYCDGENVAVENISKSKLSAYFNDISHSVTVTADENIENISKNVSEINISSSGETANYKVDYILNEGNYDFSPHYRWIFDGIMTENLSVKQTDKGMLLSGGGGINCSVTTFDSIFDEEEAKVDIQRNSCTIDIQSDKDVMVYFDSDMLQYYEVQSGDVNADGLFNVADLVAMQRWILADPDATLVDWKAGDLCQDSRINVFDMCLMRKMIANTL